MRLDAYTTGGFDRGAPRWKEALWLAISGLLVASWLPGSGWRKRLLRAFGATIGWDVAIKPGVRIKFPWRLSVGDYSWIGEDVWIDNLPPRKAPAPATFLQEVHQHEDFDHHSGLEPRRHH